MQNKDIVTTTADMVIDMIRFFLKTYWESTDVSQLQSSNLHLSPHRAMSRSANVIND